MTKQHRLIMIAALCIILAFFTVGCGRLVEGLVDMVVDRIAADGNGEGAPPAAPADDNGTDLRDGDNVQVRQSTNLPPGFPDYVPLLSNDIQLAQHAMDGGEDHFFINFSNVTDHDPDAYRSRMIAAGWEVTSFTEMSGAWIISGRHGDNYSMQASVFKEDNAGALVVTTDISAY